MAMFRKCEHCEELEREVLQLRKQLAIHTGEDPTIRTKAGAEVQSIFNYWRNATGHKQAKLTQDRARKIRARLREGYSVKFILTAIDGAAFAPHRNERGVPYDDLELICRNGSKLEQFHDRAPANLPYGLGRWAS